VGVSFGTNGWGISASMQNAHGDGNSDAALQNNTHINASNSATILSGGDTNIVGASVNANQVVANIGGNLNIASVQDTTVSAAHQSSAGGGFSVSTMGGASASFNAQKGHADGNYAGVNEQARIQAGSGGFDITVKGNTDLKGAVIGSTADASKNSDADVQRHSGPFALQRIERWVQCWRIGGPAPAGGGSCIRERIRRCNADDVPERKWR
jgi:filamentous hemagglutinin